MRAAEKIKNAKNRIDELERLIKYWNKSEEVSSDMVDFSFKIEDKVAQTLMI